MDEKRWADALWRADAVAQRVDELSRPRADSGYDAAKTAYRKAYEEQKAASAALQSFPRSSTGMHTDEVKFSAEFRTAKANFQRAQSAENAAMQLINKQFGKELKEARGKYGPNWYRN